MHNAYTLNEDTLNLLAEDGYGLIDHFLTEEEIDAFIDRFNDLAE
ncbi:MAG: hypothetical protein ACOC30_02035 [Marinilabilia sp.]